MKRLVLILFLLSSAAIAGAESQLYGFDAMERLELLPFLAPNGVQTKQFISYDTGGGNSDGGFDRFRRYDDNGEWVFFDEIGPGCLYRQQMNVFSTYTVFPAGEVRIHMYFDDQTTPSLDMSFNEFFGRNQVFSAPFSPPLAFFDNSGRKNGPLYAISYYPFPFQKRLKIAAYRAGGLQRYDGALWYQYTYQKFPPGTPVQSWGGRQVDSSVVRDKWNHVGLDPKDETGSAPFQASVSVPKGSTVRVLDLKGQGSIGSLKIGLQPWTKDTFFHTMIRIVWDDGLTSLEMPIGCLFGGGGDTIGTADVSSRTLKTLLFGFDSATKEFYSYWPMPYWSRATIDIVNLSAADLSSLTLSGTSKTSSVLSYSQGSCGYFCAKRTTDISPDEAYYSRAFSANGHGKVMGIIMYSTGYAMDGDEFTYIDDSRTPQIHGDGTEDDHNQGWGGYAVQKPYWGGLINGYQGGYRLYINDSYLFQSRINIRYEHSVWGAGPTGQKTDSVVWYYLANPGSRNLALTDELDVGNSASETAHGYGISGQTWAGSTTSSYDKYEQGDPYPTTDDGRAFTGSSHFRARISPSNEGVRIRRRTNRNLSNIQQSNVYVDGVRIPDTPWYFCDLPAPSQSAFADTDFEIPAQYTKGKDHVDIKLERVSGQPPNSSNEYYYWVYSYGKTPLTPVPPEPISLMSRYSTETAAVKLAWWGVPDDASEFVIERLREKEVSFTRIGTASAGSGGYSDAAVQPFTNYTYRVCARNSAGSSPWASVQQGTGAVPGMRNFAIGATASASSVWDSNYTPDKANDAALDTRWNSAMGRISGEWLALDLGEERRIDAVVFYQETFWTRISSYSVQCWVGGTWKDVYEGTNMADVAVCRFDPVRTSKIRLLVKQTTGNTPTIKEFCVFDSQRPINESTDEAWDWYW